MKRLIAFILTVLIVSSMFGRVAAADNPQPLFDIDVLIKVAPAEVNGSQVWMATFKVLAVLKDPTYRAYFNALAVNNTTRANEEFGDFVRQLVYENLKDNLERRFEAANVSSTIYLPEGGPVRVLDNWSARVTFVLTNFLISTDGKVLRCPLTGDMEFVFKGHVFDYRWNKMTLILPEGYELKNLAPKPDDFSDNVAIWTNGSYIPLIELYTPTYTFLRYINSTHRAITLSFDPNGGYVQFNATFSPAPEYDSSVDYLLQSFRNTMDIVSIDTSERNGTLLIIGVAKPDVAYQETSDKRIWKAMIKLPGRFDEVEVTTGTYQIAPDNTVIITVEEEKPSKLPYVVGGLVLVALVAVFLWKKRGSSGGEEEGESFGEESKESGDGSGDSGEGEPGEDLGVDLIPLEEGD
ncbi:hypothetical protein A3L11_02510 [Thermococcus siculi]|uniref:Uncharacterized protein n=1 Tax=Thermococcus siculi TaxID=72803 RepID=A0A2Z2MK36_9EURY|nr:hypothetical protein [Thermococcus siculi]ASJ08158.1 hypothetical protein A3L11_02510 [Thermococcus siculi]